MTPTLPPKAPAICFIILSVTLVLGGLGTFGAFILLHYYYPDSSTRITSYILAVNGVLCWLLATACAWSAWKLLKQGATAKSIARNTWGLVAGFTLWTLFFDALYGWSHGGIVEVFTWGILETLIGIYLVKTRHEPIV
jgi:hypothetical protein